MQPMSLVMPEKKPLHILIYGEPGSGKTKASLQVAKLGKTLFVALEKGVLQHHIAGLPPENLIMIGSVSIDDLTIIYKNIRDFQAIAMKDTYTEAEIKRAKSIEESFTGATVELEKYTVRPYEFIIFDSLSDMQKDTLITINPIVAGSFKDTKQMQIQDWGRSNAMLDMITDAFTTADAPYVPLYVNTIWIAHEKVFTGKNDSIAKLLPRMSGQNPESVCAKMDIVAYSRFNAMGTTRTQEFIVQKHGQFNSTVVKDRTDLFGAKVVDSQPGACDIMVKICAQAALLSK